MSGFVDVAVLALNKWSPDLADNITKSNAFLKHMKNKKRINLLDGGKTIEEDLDYAENGTFGWFSGYDVLNTTPSQTVASAEFDWKQANVNVLISGEEMRKVSGSARKFGLLETRMKNAQRTMKNKINAGLYADGTGSNGKEMGGLQLLVSDTPETGIVGGIDRASNPWWRNQKISLSQDKSIEGDATPQQVVENMADMLLRVSASGDMTDFILCDDNMFTKYRRYLEEIKRIDTSDVGDATYLKLTYQGIPVVRDPACPADHMYFLNTDFLRLRVHKDANFAATGERKPYNQDALVYPILFMGNMTCSNCNKQGVICA